MSKKFLTACPLDCYDACSVVYEDNKLRGDKDHPITNGYLCPNLNSFLKTPRITKPRFEGKEIELDEALEILTSKLKEVEPSKTLYYKGHGNFGVMQNITANFFAKYGSVFTRGSLCDSAGEAGIIRGRGESLSLPIDQIQKSEVVVIWGRNIDTSNSHLMPFIKDKTLITIDPVKTKIALMSDLHIQIEPHCDMKLAILLARFILMQGLEDEAFIENRSDNYDYFVEFIRSFRVKQLMNKLGMSAKEINYFVDNLTQKRVVFLVGVGVQKYRDGADILHMIDSLAAMLGLFGKEGCGVSYLANSSFGFELPFEASKLSEPKPNVDFSKYDLVFLQASNIANQMPNSQRVSENLQKTFLVYFGLYENESSHLAQLVIPAKSFLAKSDLRLSYGHDFVLKMPKLIDEDFGISEYDLTNSLLRSFNLDLLKEQELIEEKILQSNSYKDGEYLRSKSYKEIPYSDRFYNDDEEFYFIDEIEHSYVEGEGYYLISSKAKHSLNSQFERSSKVFISAKSGFKEGERVVIKSEWGSYHFEVGLDERLRDDCLLIYSGTKGVNYLTPGFLSYEGDGACYQDVKVEVFRL